MCFVLITHDVADYAAWKIGFDAAANKRKTAGEIEYQLLHERDDKNQIVHFSRWQSYARAKAFFESDEIRNLRIELGVTEPTFVYLNELEQGVL